jgi:hypothetical protein
MIPKILFGRATLPSAQWSDGGELETSPGGRYSLEALDFGAYSLTRLIEKAEREGIVRTEGASWSQWYIVSEAWKEQMACNLNSEKAKPIQFAILGIVIRAFPEAWCELVWEEVEDQLWEVIESTCVPFLGVLDIEDIKEYLAHTPRSDSFLLEPSDGENADFNAVAKNVNI